MYENEFEPLHRKLAEDLFDAAKKEAGLEKSESALISKLVEDIDREVNAIRRILMQLNLAIAFAVLIWILCMVIAGVFQIILLYITVGPIGIVAIGVLAHLQVKQRKKMKDDDSKHRKSMGELQETIRTFVIKLEHLNDIMRKDATQELLAKTLPFVSFDDSFERSRQDELETEFGFKAISDALKHADCGFTPVSCLSGHVNGYPFILANGNCLSMDTRRCLKQGIVDLSGYLRSENAEINISKDISLEVHYPRFFSESILIYGNDACPELSFARTPFGNRDSDIDRHMESIKEALFGTEVEKALKPDKSERPGMEFARRLNFSNISDFSEFEKLFTPLSRKKLEDLASDIDEHEFYFFKLKKLNIIVSRTPLPQYDYQSVMDEYNPFYEERSDYFISHHMDSLKSTFYAMAPLITIPLYEKSNRKQMKPAIESKSIYADWQHQAIACEMDERLTRPKGTITKMMIDTELVSSDMEKDVVKITAKSFRTESKVVTERNGKSIRRFAVSLDYEEHIEEERQIFAAIRPLDEATKKRIEAISPDDLRDGLEEVTIKDRIVAYPVDDKFGNLKVERLLFG